MVRRAARVAAVATAIVAADCAQAGINFIGGWAAPSLHTDRIATGDLDGDGRADVVEVSVRDRLLAVHLAGRPDEPFLDGTNAYYLRGQSPEWPAIGDLDGDRIPDVACADRAAGGVWVLHGQFEGRLGPPTLIRVGRRPHAVVLADVDGRNGRDLIVADAAPPGRIFVLLNQGGGAGFGGAVEVQAGKHADELLAVDVNRDGRPDIVSLNLAPPRAKEVVISRFSGLADGVPEFDTQPRTVVVEGNPAHLLAAELTGDSAIDLALVDQRDAMTGEIVVLTGDGSGGFTPSRFAVGCPFFTGGTPCPLRGVTALDGNGDRRTDLVVALVDPRWNGPEISQDALQVFAGTGSGRFTPGPVFATFKDPRAITSAQLNDDCQPDLVVALARNLTLQPFFGYSSPGGHPNGTPCSRQEECLSGRCTDGLCCASFCQEGERCDVAGHEGACTPPAAIRACARDDECTAESGQPFCVHGLCCDERCAGGRCNRSGFEGLCIPDAVEDLRQLAEPCRFDDECASRVCDAFAGICCDRRCDDFGTFCDERGHCAPVVDSGAAHLGRTVEQPASCRGDCDGDGVVSVNEVVRIVAIVLGNGDIASCGGADPLLDRCLSIDDVIDVVNASLSGCVAPAADG